MRPDGNALLLQLLPNLCGICAQRIDAQHGRCGPVVRLQQQTRLFEPELLQITLGQPLRVTVSQRVIFRLCGAVRLRQTVDAACERPQHPVEITGRAPVCAAQPARQLHTFIDRRRVRNAVEPHHLIDREPHQVENARLQLFQLDSGKMREVKIAHRAVLQHAACQRCRQCRIARRQTRGIFAQRGRAPCALLPDGKQRACRGFPRRVDVSHAAVHRRLQGKSKPGAAAEPERSPMPRHTSLPPQTASCAP